MGQRVSIFCRNGANVEIAPLEIYRVKPNRDASRIFPTTHTIYHRTGGSIKRPSGVKTLKSKLQESNLQA